MFLSPGRAQFVHHGVYHVFSVIARDDVVVGARARSRGGRPRQRLRAQRGQEGGENVEGETVRRGTIPLLWAAEGRQEPVTRT